MSARPGVIIASKKVPFERPRTAAVRAAAEFRALEAELWALLRQEVQQAEGEE
jgi:NitT/TauT family transport system ATP-binding protein